MEYVVINAVLYVFAFVFYWLRRKTIDSGFLLLFLYALTSILCAVQYYKTPYEWDVNLIGFIYLFVVVMLFFRPYLTSNMSEIHSNLISNTSIRTIKILELLSYLYILCSAISIYFSWNAVSNNILLDDWNSIYRDHYKFEKNPYVNVFDGIAKRYSDYFRPVILLYVFFAFSNRASIKDTIKAIIIGLSVVGASFFAAILIASRGNMVNILLLILTCFLLFKNKIPPIVKKILFILGLLLVSIVLVYTLAITSSRFGEEAESSLLYYFGHAFLTFNANIFATVTQFQGGSYCFEWFYDLFDIPKTQAIGITRPGSFYTFVGGIYRDYGPIFTFVFAVIFSFLFKRIITKKNIDFADVYLYIFVLTRLTFGVLVIGTSEGFLWFVALLIYLFLKFIIHLRVPHQIK